jgi:hypothetical protein
MLKSGNYCRIWRCISHTNHLTAQRRRKSPHLTVTRPNYKEQRAEEKVLESDIHDENIEILGRRRSMSFVDRVPLIFQAGHGGRGAVGGKGLFYLNINEDNISCYKESKR